MYQISTKHDGKGYEDSWEARLEFDHAGGPWFNLEGYGLNEEEALSALQVKYQALLSELQQVEWPAVDGRGYVVVCFDCARARRKRVIAAPISDWEVCTCWTGKCECCGRECGVTDVRNFGYPWHKPLLPAGPSE